MSMSMDVFVMVTSVFPVAMSFSIGRETLHYLIMMMSLHCIANDVIGLSQDYK